MRTIVYRELGSRRMRAATSNRRSGAKSYRAMGARLDNASARLAAARRRVS